ncbi:MAG: hypothetical protein ACK4FV_06995 [Candidatus Nitrosocaldus sp.]
MVESIDCCADDIEDLFMQTLQILGIEGHSRYSPIISHALDLYMEFSSRYRVKSRMIMAYAVMYAVLRSQGYALTPNAFAVRVGVNVRRLASYYRAMQRVLGLTIPNPTLHAYIDELVRWLRHGANDKGIDTVRLKDEAYRLVDDIMDIMNSKGVNPVGVAAAILYLASDDDGKMALSIKDLASISGISMVTIRKRIEELRPFLKVRLTVNKKN